MCIVKVLDRLEMTSFSRNLLLYGCIDVLCGISACQKVSSLTQISSSTNMIDKHRRPIVVVNSVGLKQRGQSNEDSRESIDQILAIFPCPA